jgi:membrane protease YdiL (CAAX protease family)
VYRHFDLVHEDAHELLKSMGEVGGGWQRALAIFAAVVLAPLNEEIMFRGHIQSTIRRVLMPRPGVLLAEAIAVAVDPSLMPPPLPMDYESANPPMAAPVEHVPPPAGPRTFLASAGAILITSTVFAAIHPMWSWPPIFVLSLFLGIAYERKGNLWTSIFVHALFNGAMITAYLSLQHPGT